MHLRNVLIASTTLVAGTIVGATTQHFASADVSSGDRPVLIPIETCRIADTRPAPDNVGPKSSPLGPAEIVTINAQEPGTDCTGKIPAGATALSLNVSALNATSNSFLTIWPDGTQPTASALNPAPGQRVFNAVTTELAADQTFRIFNNRGNVDVFVDINGYYENHNHDDLYPTKAAVDGQHESQKFINLQTIRDHDGDATTKGVGGPIDFATSLVLPPDYTPGTDLRLEINFMNSDFTPAPCSFQLRKSYLTAFRPSTGIDLDDDGGSVSDGLVVGPGDTLSFPGTAIGEYGQLTATVSRPGTIDFEPGDALNFGFFDGFTNPCGTTVKTHSAALYYD